ncbi:TPA: hypothetical protein U1D13_001255 [Streptococcus suis]|nr:hypothetical protein [Streptococcus suis]HEM3626847.1 hypothetical protein [Streptococcus suis]HEM3653548.1 hypothetical protein [Streptococcus suis]HEM3656960.1 hypothetical protein [Streptococcus suis]HEM3700476.1 hypothetical protein [Streptococcus suis]
MDRRNQAWSTEEIDYLRTFAEFPDGDNCIVVSDYLKRTPGAVRTEIHKLRQEGVHTKLLDKWTEWEINALKNMNGKVTVKEQAELLGRSYSSVAHKRGELRLRTERKMTPAGRGKEIRKLAHQGLFRKEIADKLGLNYSSLCHYIKREGIRCVDDEEGRLLGIKEAWKRHNQEMSWVFHKERQHG